MDKIKKKDINMGLQITEKQARLILKNYLKICKITHNMNTKVQKTFAVDGRMLGDIGECVLAYAFGLILNDKQEKGFDATTKTGKKVEIKVRTNKNHIHLSDSTIKNVKKDKCHLLVAEIDKDNREIKIVANALLQPTVEKKRDAGFITRKKLKEHCDGHKLRLIHDKIGSWHIIPE